MECVIQAENINKAFGSVLVLQALNLQVSKGELIAIMGKSGSGKSTLLHILGTLDTPDSGFLKIAGKEPFKYTPDKLAEFRNKEIGFVFQFHHLLPEFNLAENISMPGYIAGKSKDTIQARASFLIEYFGLRNQVNNKPGQMSGGEQQRGAICRALFNEPSIILADEPTGNLDQQNAEEFHRLIRKLSTDFNQTFIIVTHQADLADQCDKVMILESGQLKMR